MVNHLCKIAGVSRSGYYNHFSLKASEQRKQMDKRDEKVKRIILKAFHFKGVKKEHRKIGGH